MLDRRSYLQGAALSLGVPAAGVSLDRLAEMTDHRWTAVETPTSRTLNAAATASTGPVAAGRNGLLLERTDDAWTTVTRNGPGGDGSDLTTLGVTDDGDRVWMAGASGALGTYDVRAGERTDRTAPDDVTDDFTALSVAGSPGDEHVYLGDSSGTVHVSTDGGESWTHLTPGSGATIHGLDCYGPASAVLVDGAGAAFETATGTDWHRAGVDAEGRLAAVDADGADDVTVVGARVHERTDTGWHATDVTGATLTDVAVCSCGCVHAVGANGTIAHQPGEEMGNDGGWEVSSPTDVTLHGVALGYPHVAVGASGTILER